MPQKNANTATEKIKKRGYWEIEFKPSGQQDEVIETFPELKKTVREASVTLRGWDYPHCPTQTDEKQDLYPLGNNRLESWIEWGTHKEVWQFFKTGQFKHLLALREDWFGEDSWVTEHLSRIEPSSIIDFVNTTYTITEIYKFLKNLVDKEFYKQGVEVEITLSNTANRKITLLSPGRVPIMGNYWSRGNRIPFIREYGLYDLKKPVEDLSQEAILEIFQQFNWDNPPVDIIQNDQEKLLGGRL